jgi:hypothetical protein
MARAIRRHVPSGFKAVTTMFIQSSNLVLHHRVHYPADAANDHGDAAPRSMLQACAGAKKTGGLRAPVEPGTPRGF